MPLYNLYPPLLKRWSPVFIGGLWECTCMYYTCLYPKILVNTFYILNICTSYLPKCNLWCRFNKISCRLTDVSRLPQWLKASGYYNRNVTKILLSKRVNVDVISAPLQNCQLILKVLHLKWNLFSGVWNEILVHKICTYLVFASAPKVTKLHERQIVTPCITRPR